MNLLSYVYREKQESFDERIMYCYEKYWFLFF